MNKLLITIFVASGLVFCGSVMADESKDMYNNQMDKIAVKFKEDKTACDKLKDNEKDVCVQAAKSERDKAKADAKEEKKVRDAEAKAKKDKNMADYKVAREKCDALNDDAKDKCIAEAKNQFGIESITDKIKDIFK